MDSRCKTKTHSLPTTRGPTAKDLPAHSWPVYSNGDRAFGYTSILFPSRYEIKPKTVFFFSLFMVWGQFIKFPLYFAIPITKNYFP